MSRSARETTAVVPRMVPRMVWGRRNFQKADRKAPAAASEEGSPPGAAAAAARAAVEARGRAGRAAAARPGRRCEKLLLLGVVLLLLLLLLLLLQGPQLPLPMLLGRCCCVFLGGAGGLGEWWVGHVEGLGAWGKRERRHRGNSWCPCCMNGFAAVAVAAIRCNTMPLCLHCLLAGGRWLQRNTQQAAHSQRNAPHLLRVATAARRRAHHRRPLLRRSATQPSAGSGHSDWCGPVMPMRWN